METRQLATPDPHPRNSAPISRRHMPISRPPQAKTAPNRRPPAPNKPNRRSRPERSAAQSNGSPRPSALSSFAPNKPNLCRFWRKNPGRPRKQTQSNPIPAALRALLQHMSIRIRRWTMSVSVNMNDEPRGVPRQRPSRGRDQNENREYYPKSALLTGEHCRLTPPRIWTWNRGYVQRRMRA